VSGVPWACRGRPNIKAISRPLEYGPRVPEGHSLAEWRSCMPVDREVGRT
jgi:hypothetical protein